MSLLVICPSRGRPAAAAALLKVFSATKALAGTELIFAVDHDDPQLEAYAHAAVTLHVGPSTGSMNGALNAAAHALLNADPGIEVVGFIGDDHRFVTPGWDALVLDLLRQHPGVAYGDDTNWHEKLPTMWFLSRQVAGFFGMGLKSLKHLFIDNYWLELAGEAGCLTYLPDVVIEHRHPAYGKADWDEGYRRVNSEAMYSADGAAFREWQSTRKPQDVALLRELLTANT